MQVFFLLAPVALLKAQGEPEGTQQLDFAGSLQVEGLVGHKT